MINDLVSSILRAPMTKGEQDTQRFWFDRLAARQSTDGLQMQIDQLRRRVELLEGRDPERQTVPDRQSHDE